MVTDKDGYAHLIQYLSENLALFTVVGTDPSESSVLELFEEQLAAQIIMICGQNPELSFAQRNTVIREIDAVVYDLEEVLGKVAHQKATIEQIHFISEFSGLIKNLFDQEVSDMLK
ncbi:DUF3802 family protein [Shewanella avicenniae]|uniref:DUF3802 family protein n=1 Tax=Shewanella avicenniae TaxID=2814294 RepID=A0ABX7QVD3_9GAMM|nr:DUF3802 family protein [Shewanella avicenniae]QSX35462.1 DUF3802 family protein [Shewanella avicenniae]